MLEAVVRYETFWLEDLMAVIDRSNALEDMTHSGHMQKGIGIRK
jgi:hypothetical protein